MVSSGDQIEYPLGVEKSEWIKSKKNAAFFRSTLLLQKMIVLSPEASHSEWQMFFIKMLCCTIEMLDM